MAWSLHWNIGGAALMLFMIELKRISSKTHPPVELAAWYIDK